MPKFSIAVAESADDDAHYCALQARDARFDGSFFTAVTSTGIYCRPVCKVRVPKRENCRFYTHAAQAEAAGFRPCLRCRPELAPQALAWSTHDASHTLAMQAAHMLDEGVGDARSLAALASRLGVSDRHLRRIFQAHVGVAPLQYLQTRRLLTAKQLLSDTALPVAHIALSSGFASLRSFNAAFVAHYQLNPTQLRKKQSALPSTAPPTTPGQAFAHGSALVQLGYRPPYDVQSMLGFFHTRRLDAIEFVANNAQQLCLFRTFFLEHQGHSYSGWLAAEFDQARCTLRLRVADSLLPVLPLLLRRVRNWLDLDAQPERINAVLEPHFTGSGGLRVPGCLDGFELAVRAVLGQQVTVAAGRTFAQRLVARFGATIATPWPQLNRLFPSAQSLATAEPAQLGELGIVRQRQAAIQGLARAVVAGQLELNRSSGALQTVEQLKALPGIGDWTAQYIAMRALRWPDAFPAGDVALHKALGVQGSKRAAQEAQALSQAWRPWRSYAVLRAWHTL